jgi:hypothetical protein
MTGIVTSGTIAWTAETSDNTTLGLSIRTGNTPIPDATWTSFSSTTNGANIGSGFRYIQYQAAFATTVLNQTPVLQEVRFLYNTIPDTIPPTISTRSPAANATNVALDASVSVTFNEPMNGATFTSSTFRLCAAGSSTDVAANLIVNGPIAVLQPVGYLLVNTV